VASDEGVAAARDALELCLRERPAQLDAARSGAPEWERAQVQRASRRVLPLELARRARAPESQRAQVRAASQQQAKQQAQVQLPREQEQRLELPASPQPEAVREPDDQPEEEPAQQEPDAAGPLWQPLLSRRVPLLRRTRHSPRLASGALPFPRRPRESSSSVSSFR
jgi:hypothetical protein